MTQLGRVVAIVTAFTGTINMAILINAVSRAIQLKPAEERAIRALDRIKVSSDKKRLASRVLAAFIALARHRMPPPARAGARGANAGLAGFLAYAVPEVRPSRAARRAGLIARLRPLSGVPAPVAFALSLAVREWTLLHAAAGRAQTNLDEVVKVHYELVELRRVVERKFARVSAEFDRAFQLAEAQRAAAAALLAALPLALQQQLARGRDREAAAEQVAAAVEGMAAAKEAAEAAPRADEPVDVIAYERKIMLRRKREQEELAQR